jgi:hypothetical protein
LFILYYYHCFVFLNICFNSCYCHFLFVLNFVLTLASAADRHICAIEMLHSRVCFLSCLCCCSWCVSRCARVTMACFHSPPTHALGAPRDRAAAPNPRWPLRPADGGQCVCSRRGRCPKTRGAHGVRWVTANASVFFFTGHLLSWMARSRSPLPHGLCGPKRGTRRWRRRRQRT